MIAEATSMVNFSNLHIIPGRASTRVRFRALSLVSSRPIRTACGAFHAYVSLDGRQSATAMQIYRTHERGGEFVAPLGGSGGEGCIQCSVRICHETDDEGHHCTGEDTWACDGNYCT
jgi:hypothetical protein